MVDNRSPPRRVPSKKYAQGLPTSPFIQHGRLVVRTLAATGTLTVAGRTHTWTGSKEPPLDPTPPGHLTVYGAANCRIRYHDDPRTGFRRDVDPAANTTPCDPAAREATTVAMREAADLIHFRSPYSRNFEPNLYFVGTPGLLEAKQEPCFASLHQLDIKVFSGLTELAYRQHVHHRVVERFPAHAHGAEMFRTARQVVHASRPPAACPLTWDA
ncbi:hypothetical protein ACIRUY_05635 [Streptomyces erythrochromogenes]|uniref:hypothetical protein n=1 Tax=Streptomyces erythrochromogenes TaxID=285574 RepID=UPI00381D9C88